MPAKKTAVVPPPTRREAGPVEPCPACGSRACALTGLPACRHTGKARTPDPTAAARLAALRLPIRTRSAA